MTSPVIFRQVCLRAFRNIRMLEFEPHPGLNVITGGNGEGKTSVLEALYLVATTKSFRADRLEHVVQIGKPHALVRCQVLEEGISREQRVIVTGNRRRVLLDGKPVRSLVSYAVSTPVVLFHPGDLELVTGSASSRRKLLDQIGMFLDASAPIHRIRYEQALKERQRILEQSGDSAVELAAFERVAAEHGVALARIRALCAERLTAAVRVVFGGLASELSRLDVQYRPGSGGASLAGFGDELASRRRQDVRRGSATFGPQRDELELLIDGRSARRHASQGQQRLLTLALKLAELECLCAARGAHPVLLLDDVSSELDPARTGAVYELLNRAPSQIFVTTTRPELLGVQSTALVSGRSMALENGALREFG